MSKKCMQRREAKRAKLIKKSAGLRAELRDIINDPNISFQEKLKAIKLLEKNIDSCAIRLNRRCPFAGRARGVYRKPGLSRVIFRDSFNRGEIPGMEKSSW